MNLDFDIVDSHNPKYLKILDTSDWKYIESKPSIIEIIVPGYESEVIHYFTKGKINIFNSNNLLLGCEDCEELSDLPDGVYNITIKGSPDSYSKTKSYLKTDSWAYMYQRMFLKREAVSNDLVFSTLQGSYRYILGAKSAVARKDVYKASLYYTEALEKLKSLNCDGCI